MTKSTYFLFFIVCSFAYNITFASDTPPTKSFAQRINQLTEAIEQHLSNTPKDSENYKKHDMRIAWFFADGDDIPDALVILKPQRTECVLIKDAQKCRGLILLGQQDGHYNIKEFVLTDRIFLKQEKTGISAFYYAKGNDTIYRGFRFNGTDLKGIGGEISFADLKKTMKGVLLDDRNLPSLNAQRIISHQSPDNNVKLAPAHFVLDEVNISNRRKAWKPTDKLIYNVAFDNRIKVLVAGLSPDLDKITSQLGWLQTLETRLWSCLDWMVPRKFWLIEGNRLGQIGLCADPLILGLQHSVLKSNQEYLGLARNSLLQQVGMAYLLRQSPLTPDDRDAIKNQNLDTTMLQVSTAIGLLLGEQLGLQSLAQAHSYHEKWKQIAQNWFEEYEYKIHNFIFPSPELTRYKNELEISGDILNCMRNKLDTTCKNQTREAIKAAYSLLQMDGKK